MGGLVESTMRNKVIVDDSDNKHNYTYSVLWSSQSIRSVILLLNHIGLKELRYDNFRLLSSTQFTLALVELALELADSNLLTS